MSPTSPPPEHPSEFSPEVLEQLERLLRVFDPVRVHDPFAGRGVRLGALCDRLGIPFTGTDRESYPNADARVALGDACDARAYPAGTFVVVTSPVYLNRISTDYVNGPTPTTKRNGRRAYGISLGHALHPGNLARLARCPDAFYAGHGHAVEHWREQVIVNVDLPMRDPWCALLEVHGYGVLEVLEVGTRRYRGLANSEKRAECEVVIVARAERDYRSGRLVRKTRPL